MKRRTRLAIAAGCATAVFASPATAFAETQHKVVSGDTLWAIGVANNTTWQALAAYNNIQNPNLIFVGQDITIPNPGYVAPAPAAPVQHSYTQPHYTAQRTSDYVQHSSYTSTAPGPSSSGSGSFTGIWACIARYESGGNPSINTGNGYYGGLQFTLGTWQANGGSGNPANASAAEQQRVANNVVQNSGGSYGAWPNTSRMCGV
jgi:LysM repeat protein